jgi:hypothetical protein
MVWQLGQVKTRLWQWDQVWGNSVCMCNNLCYWCVYFTLYTLQSLLSVHILYTVYCTIFIIGASTLHGILYNLYYWCLYFTFEGPSLWWSCSL